MFTSKKQTVEDCTFYIIRNDFKIPITFTFLFNGTNLET